MNNLISRSAVLQRTAGIGGKAVLSRALSTLPGKHNNPLARDKANAIPSMNFHSTSNLLSSPFDTSGGVTVTKTTSTSTKKKRRKFVPPKAAVKLTDKARKFFRLLLEKPPKPDIIGKFQNWSVME